jgi:hypothetical protein
MFTNPKNNTQRLAGLFFIILSLTFLPLAVGKVNAGSLNVIVPPVGYTDHAFGPAVKPEPSADVAESKLWWNDGFWWAIMFEPASSSYKIYWLDWGTQTWKATATLLDSRTDETGLVATRFDALWDESAHKLYIVSHIKLINPSRVTNPDNWARLYRYSYNATTKTYSLDSSFPVAVNRDKTEVLVLDKDTAGRLWVTYVSRIPNPDPLGSEVYNVYFNYTTTPGDDLIWATPTNIATIDNTAATVGIHDVATVIRFGSNVGLMWSNFITGNFYFATHPAASDPASNWTIQAVSVPSYSIIANDHIRLVTNSAGQVFAAVKTLNTNPTDAYLGILARDVNGTFSFHQYSTVDSIDTRPTLLYDENANQLRMFVSSNEVGGVICLKSMTVTAQLSSMQFPLGNCADNGSGAPVFIGSSQYHNINNSTTSKHNINANTGGVVLAGDDVNGAVYLHNTLGNPLAVITNAVPARGANVSMINFVVSLTFSHNMDAATLTPANIQVTGPNGAVAGTVTYVAAARTATFHASEKPVDGTYQVTIKSALHDASGRSTYNAGETYSLHVTAVATTNIFLPIINK